MSGFTVRFQDLKGKTFVSALIDVGGLWLNVADTTGKQVRYWFTFESHHTDTGKLASIHGDLMNLTTITAVTDEYDEDTCKSVIHLSDDTNDVVITFVNEIDCAWCTGAVSMLMWSDHYAGWVDVNR